MMLAESRGFLDCSWAVDWSKWTNPNWAQADPLNTLDMEQPLSKVTPFWNGGLTPSPIEAIHTYNADGFLSTARTIAPLQRHSWNRLCLSGWLDSIVSIGTVCEAEYKPSRLNIHDICSTIEKWERLTGGPWHSPSDSRRAIFNRTLIANAYPLDNPSDWRELFSPSSPERSGGLAAQEAQEEGRLR